MVMHGETGRCVSDHCNKHFDAFMKKKMSNIWDHFVSAHGGNIVDFRYDLSGRYRQVLLSRQQDEAKRLIEEAGSWAFS